MALNQKQGSGGAHPPGRRPHPAVCGRHSLTLLVSKSGTDSRLSLQLPEVWHFCPNAIARTGAGLTSAEQKVRSGCVPMAWLD